MDCSILPNYIFTFPNITIHNIYNYLAEKRLNNSPIKLDSPKLLIDQQSEKKQDIIDDEQPLTEVLNDKINEGTQKITIEPKNLKRALNNNDESENSEKKKPKINNLASPEKTDDILIKDNNNETTREGVTEDPPNDTSSPNAGCATKSQDMIKVAKEKKTLGERRKIEVKSTEVSYCRKMMQYNRMCRRVLPCRYHK